MTSIRSRKKWQLFFISLILILLPLVLVADQNDSESIEKDLNTVNISAYATNENSPRTFAVSDRNPFPGKSNIFVSDQDVNEPFTFYIYVINNGENDKDQEAKEITVTLKDLTNGVDVICRTSLTIDKNIGYAMIDNVVYPKDAHVQIIVEGLIQINSNDNKSFWSKGISNYFKIGNPQPNQPPEKTGLIWEQEEVF